MKYLVFDALHNVFCVEGEAQQDIHGVVRIFRRDRGKEFGDLAATFTNPVTVTEVDGIPEKKYSSDKTTYVSFKVNGHPRDVARKLRDLETGKYVPYFYDIHDLNIVEI